MSKQSSGIRWISAAGSICRTAVALCAMGSFLTHQAAAGVNATVSPGWNIFVPPSPPNYRYGHSILLDSGD